MTSHRPRKSRKKHQSRLLQWHRWLGLSLLVFLLLAALSGLPLVYKQALIQQLVAPEAHLPEGYGPPQIAAQLDSIAARLGDSGSAYLIKAPNATEPYWTLTRDADNQVQLLAIDSLQAYEQNSWLLKVLAFARELHTELFSGVTGEIILLLSALAGLFFCISGVILWWPSKRSFRWRWVLPRKLHWAYLMHYHRHAGVVAVPVLLIILLTGSLMLWQKLTGPLLTPLAPTQLALPDTAGAPRPLTRAELFLAAQAKIPDGWPTFVRLNSATVPAFTIRYRLPNEWHSNGRSSIKIDTTTSALALSPRADQVPWPHRLLNQNYPLHSGYGMNSAYRLFIFISGLVLLWLCITGGLSFWRARSQ